MSVDFGEDRLRGNGSLPETFYDLTRVKYLIFIQWCATVIILIIIPSSSLYNSILFYPFLVVFLSITIV